MLIHHIPAVTEAAALACHPWIGRGCKNDADNAAVEAMRTAFQSLTGSMTIVIGEGEKDEAPRLYAGEQLGQGIDNQHYDVAIDPLEGTTYLAKGLPNALSVAGFSRKGTMFNPAPAFYMDKLAVPPAARGLVTPDMPIEEQLRQLARALDKKIEQLTIYILDRPRHHDLIESIHRNGAKVMLYPAGDVVGALLAATDSDQRVDALMGIGGSPEAVFTACAIKAMGGDFFARIAPQNPQEIALVADAGINTNEWLDCHQLIQGDECHFCATGITSDGLWLDGVQVHDDGFASVESCVISTSLDSPLFLKHRIPMNLDECSTR